MLFLGSEFADRRRCAQMFRKIGKLEIVSEGDLILVRGSAVFNLETAQEYAAAMAVMVEQMPTAFGVLVQVEAPPILSPEVEESIREGARQRVRRGLIAVALVTESHVGLAISSHQYDRIYPPLGVHHAFFADVDNARIWLRQHLRRAAARSLDEPS
jgi:hypothetical protein